MVLDNRGDEAIGFVEIEIHFRDFGVRNEKTRRASGRDTGDGMKLSRDKITGTSHKILAAMRQGRYFRLKGPENDIRLHIAKTFTALLFARDKIRSQKREILEGREEFELLQRRYCAEEMKKIGIDLARWFHGRGPLPDGRGSVAARFGVVGAGFAAVPVRFGAVGAGFGAVGAGFGVEGAGFGAVAARFGSVAAGIGSWPTRSTTFLWKMSR